MLQRIKISLFVALFLGVSAVHAELPPGYKVMLLTENFPPFNMAVDDKNFARDDAIDGISTDIVREMFKRAGIDYTLTLRFPWDRIYKMTLETPDFGLFSTTYNEARKPLFKWVGPLAKTSRVLLAAPGSDIQVSSLQEAAKYRIGAYKNAAVSVYLASEGITTSDTLRDQENVKKLMRGQIDLWATTDPVGQYLAKQEGITGLQVVLHFNESELFLALNRDTPDEVVNRLQAVLEQMRAEGVLDEIQKNYM